MTLTRPSNFISLLWGDKQLPVNAPRTSAEHGIQQLSERYWESKNNINTFDSYEKSLLTSSLSFLSSLNFDDSSEKVDEFIGSKKPYFQNNSSSLENSLNESRIDDFHKNLTSELLNSLKVDPVEPGVLGSADAIISNCLKVNAIATTTWLNKLFIENYHRSSVATDLLLLAGRLPYEVANPSGVSMALAGFTHVSAAVQEAAIRAFENWANLESLKILRNVQVKPKWLHDYLNNVISDLEIINETVS